MANSSANLKVMVIDDSKTIRKSAANILQDAGYNVLLANNGFDAMPIINNEHPDIIFLDIMMPRLDGYQTCALIKHNSVFREVPIIMLSSKDGLFDRAKSKLVGSDLHLTKPFDKESLLSAIQEHLNLP